MLTVLLQRIARFWDNKEGCFSRSWFGEGIVILRISCSRVHFSGANQGVKAWRVWLALCSRNRTLSFDAYNISIYAIELDPKLCPG